MSTNFRGKWVKSQLQLLALGLLAFSCADSEFSAESARIQSADATSIQEIPGRPLVASDGSLPAAVSKKPDSLSMNFPASLIKDESYKFTLDTKGVSTEFTLSDINKDLRDERSQITRTSLTQTAKQGTPGVAKQDVFDQTAKKGLLDLLVVIDNSGSMSQEQANLGARLANLLSAVSNSDWQIAVTTTSPNANGSCAIKLIKSNEANAATKFAEAVNAGTSGDGNEQGIRQARIGLECTTTPWVRANSSVAVLIVSDEDNCSDGQGCAGQLWASNNYLTDYVEITLGRKVGQNAGYYGIFSPPEAPCNTAGSNAPLYKALVQRGAAAGSLNYGNICDASYGTTLNRISGNISAILSSQFSLSNSPENTPVVKIQAKDGTVRTAVAGVDYTLNDKTLTFLAGKAPASDSKVLVDYRIGVKPLFSSVALANPPAPETLVVKVNGATLGAGDYTLTGQTLTFNTQPAALADIVIDYRINTPLINRFLLARVPLPNTLSVMVNGAASNAFAYDAARNEIVFANAPLDNAKIDFRFTYKVGPQLSYALPMMNGAFNLRILDGANLVNFVEKDGVFTIDALQHAPGKKLLFSYDLAETAPRSFTLGHKPIENSANVQVANGACNLGMGIEIVGDRLTAICGVKAKTDFTLNYKFREAQTSFDLGEIKLPEQGKWIVMIDGEAISDYTRSGSIIKLNFEPLLDSKITIQYTFPE